MKMVQGSSEEEDYVEKVPRSKAGREEMDSAIPGETHREMFMRMNPKKFPNYHQPGMKIKHDLPDGFKGKK
jgi:hypothetical protein